MTKLQWKYDPGCKIQAPLSYTDTGQDHYVISHRPKQYTVSYRPPGKHICVGIWETIEDAINAAEEHAAGEIVQSPYNPFNQKPHIRTDVKK